ncbi:MAG TPA: hypothetical protein VN750_12460 [Steroidobacteraceae bacterium]|nr:hypothetical protein [Steroidobacteraceae bacterium]
MSRQSIAGRLDTTALARMHFVTLDQAQQAEAIRRLHAAGQTPHTIAAATGLSVEQIGIILAEARAHG